MITGTCEGCLERYWNSKTTLKWSAKRATRQILENALCRTKVLMLSAHSDEAYIVESVNSGAMGYLIKHASAGTVCQAIREVQKGNTFFSPSIPKRLHKRNGKKSRD
jgi:DNA-binding NarL/FixJ family response regulator